MVGRLSWGGASRNDNDAARSAPG